MQDTIITVSAQGKMTLQRIVMDNDRDEALAFIKELVVRINNKDDGSLKNHLDSN